MITARVYENGVLFKHSVVLLLNQFKFEFRKIIFQSLINRLHNTFE
jgi:hypothetical protein